MSPKGAIMDYTFSEQLINCALSGMEIQWEEINKLICGAISAAKVSGRHQSKNEKGESKMNEKIVDMWLMKVLDKYDELREKAKETIESKDPFVKSVAEIEKEIRKLMDIYNIDIEKHRLLIYVAGGDYKRMISTEGQKLLRDLNEKFGEIYTDTSDIANEVKTLIADCDDYSDSIQILKAYGIVDEYRRLKISVDEDCFKEFMQ